MFLSEFYSQMWSNSSCSNVSIGVLKNVAKNSELRLENERSLASTALMNGDAYSPESEIPVTMTDGTVVNFAQCVNAFGNLSDQSSDIITVHDFANDVDINISFQDVMNTYNAQLKAANQLSTFMEVSANAVENSLITASEMFSDLKSLGYEVSDYSQLKDLCSNLTDSNLSFDDKYQLIVRFTGLDKLFIDGDMEDQLMNPYNLYSDLGMYTGVSPISGLMSGIGAVVEGFTHNVVEGVVALVKWKITTVGKIVKKTVQWVGKLIGKAYKKAKTTYVDPVDVKVNHGNEFNFFDIFARGYASSVYLSDGLEEYLKSHSCIRLSVFGNIYLMYIDSNRIVVDEYIKPVDLTSAVDALSGLGDFITVTTDGLLVNQSVTFDNALKVIDTLSDAPTLSSDVKEIEVYKGLCASKVAAASFFTLGYYLISNSAYHNDIVQPNDKIYSKCNMLYGWLVDLVGLYDPNAINNVSLHYNNEGLNGCVFPTFKNKSTVTNEDFIKILGGRFINYDSNFPGNNQYNLTLSTSIQSTTYGMSTDFVNVPQGGTLRHDSIAYLLYVVSCIFSESPNFLKSVYIPYDHTSKVKINSSVKTDRENISNAVRVTVGVIIAIGLTATALYLGPKVLAFRRKVKLDLYRNNSDALKIAGMLDDGNVEQAQQLAKQMRKRVRIANVMGISDAVAVSTASSISVSPKLNDSELLDNIDSIYKLIK